MTTSYRRRKQHLDAVTECPGLSLPEMKDDRLSLTLGLYARSGTKDKSSAFFPQTDCIGRSKKDLIQSILLQSENTVSLRKKHGDMHRVVQQMSESCIELERGIDEYSSELALLKTREHWLRKEWVDRKDKLSRLCSVLRSIQQDSHHDLSVLQSTANSLISSTNDSIKSEDQWQQLTDYLFHLKSETENLEKMNHFLLNIQVSLSPQPKMIDDDDSMQSTGKSNKKDGNTTTVMKEEDSLMKSKDDDPSAVVKAADKPSENGLDQRKKWTLGELIEKDEQLLSELMDNESLLKNENYSLNEIIELVRCVGSFCRGHRGALSEVSGLRTQLREMKRRDRLNREEKQLLIAQNESLKRENQGLMASHFHSEISSLSPPLTSSMKSPSLSPSSSSKKKKKKQPSMNQNTNSDDPASQMAVVKEEEQNQDVQMRDVSGAEKKTSEQETPSVKVVKMEDGSGNQNHQSSHHHSHSHHSSKFILQNKKLLRIIDALEKNVQLRKQENHKLKYSLSDLQTLFNDLKWKYECLLQDQFTGGRSSTRNNNGTLSDTSAAAAADGDNGGKENEQSEEVIKNGAIGGIIDRNGDDKSMKTEDNDIEMNDKENSEDLKMSEKMSGIEKILAKRSELDSNPLIKHLQQEIQDLSSGQRLWSKESEVDRESLIKEKKALDLDYQRLVQELSVALGELEDLRKANPQGSSLMQASYLQSHSAALNAAAASSSAIAASGSGSGSTVSSPPLKKSMEQGQSNHNHKNNHNKNTIVVKIDDRKASSMLESGEGTRAAMERDKLKEDVFVLSDALTEMSETLTLANWNLLNFQRQSYEQHNLNDPLIEDALLRYSRLAQLDSPATSVATDDDLVSVATMQANTGNVPSVMKHSRSHNTHHHLPHHPPIMLNSAPLPGSLMTGIPGRNNGPPNGNAVAAPHGHPSGSSSSSSTASSTAATVGGFTLPMTATVGGLTVRQPSLTLSQQSQAAAHHRASAPHPRTLRISVPDLADRDNLAALSQKHVGSSSSRQGSVGHGYDTALLTSALGMPVIGGAPSSTSSSSSSSRKRKKSASVATDSAQALGLRASQNANNGIDPNSASMRIPLSIASAGHPSAMLSAGQPLTAALSGRISMEPPKTRRRTISASSLMDHSPGAVIGASLPGSSALLTSAATIRGHNSGNAAAASALASLEHLHIQPNPSPAAREPRLSSSASARSRPVTHVVATSTSPVKVTAASANASLSSSSKSKSGSVGSRSTPNDSASSKGGSRRSRAETRALSAVSKKSGHHSGSTSAQLSRSSSTSRNGSQNNHKMTGLKGGPSSSSSSSPSSSSSHPNHSKHSSHDVSENQKNAATADGSGANPVRSQLMDELSEAIEESWQEFLDDDSESERMEHHNDGHSSSSTSNGKGHSSTDGSGGGGRQSMYSGMIEFEEGGRKYYTGLRGGPRMRDREPILMEDFVCIQRKKLKDCFGQIIKIWKDERSGQLKFSANVYLRPNHTNHRQLVKKREVVLLEGVEKVFPVHRISRTVSISIGPSANSTSERGRDQYFARYQFNPRTGLTSRID